MHKSTLWLIFAILCIYFSLVLCHENSNTKDATEAELQHKHDIFSSDSTALAEEEARTRRKHHHLYSLWGFYGLAIAYLVKIKVIVVAFFVGSAVYLGLRYLWPSKCGSEIYKDSPIVLDHPPASFFHHDQIPYSLDHDHYNDHSWSSSGPSFEPYSAYSNGSPTFTSEENVPSDTIPADGPTTYRQKRSLQKLRPENEQQTKQELKSTENLARQLVMTEQRIGEFMFNFLGLDTPACRRRFICEMEFKSRRNPLTSMAFRVIGRSFFDKYTNDHNPTGKANSFYQCAAVNAECVFIENSNPENPDDKNIQVELKPENNNSNEVRTTQLPVENNLADSNEVLEQENIQNLKAEFQRNLYGKRVRGDRHLKMSAPAV